MTAWLESPTLPARLVRPESYRTFPRQRLFQLLDQARRCPLVWIDAPGGSGKTMLAASYAEHRGLDGLWYQLDERENDTASIFHHLSLAAQWREPAAPPLAPLTPEYLGGLRSYSRNFFEKLFQRLAPPALLVLDDYHELDEGAALHELLRDAAESVPAGVNVLVLSRYEPPAAYARLQTHGRLQRLTRAELRLDLQEALGLAALGSGGAIDRGWVERCHREADGWTAGLILLLNRPAGAAEPATTQELLFDYIAGEIFNRLPEEGRRVLLQSAVLPDLSPPLVEHLTGCAHAGRLLAELHRGNALMERSDGGGYRLHPLFREFLLSRAERELEPPARREIHLRAGKSLAAARRWDDAALSLAAAGDWQGLAGVIPELAPQMLARGLHRTLLPWLELLPDAILEDDGWLLHWLGAARMPYDQASARQALERAYEVFEAQDDAVGLYLTWCAVIESCLLEFSDVSGLDRWLPRFEQLHGRHPRFPSPDVEIRVYANLLAYSFNRPDHPDLAGWAAHTAGLLDSCRDPVQSVMLGGALMHYHLWRGKLVEVGAVLRRIEPDLALTDLPPLVAVNLYSYASSYYWCAGEGERCLALVRRGLELAETSGVHVRDAVLAGAGIYGALAVGDPPLAKAMLGKLRTATRPNSCLEQGHYHFVLGLDAVATGDCEAAIGHLRTAAEFTGRSGVLFPHTLTLACLAHALYRMGADEEAGGLRKHARQMADRIGNAMAHHLMLLDEADIQLHRGRPDRALTPLRQALAISRDNGGLLLCYLGRGDLARLYAAALEAGIEVPYVQDLIRRMKLKPPAGEPAPERWPWPLRIYTLGRFSVVADGRPLYCEGKVQRKPLDLLRALIALGGRQVPEQRLTDALWPDADGDAGYRALITTIQRLRQLLGHPEALEFKGAQLSLDPAVAWVDVWAFERLLGQAAGGVNGQVAELCERALRVYHGPFLDGAGEPWSFSRRDRLASKFRHHILCHGQTLERGGEADTAITLYLRALDADDRDGAIHQALIRCYRSQGRQAEAEAAEQRYRATR
jgi:DNA-binding SARP family transcriptional activator